MAAIPSVTEAQDMAQLLQFVEDALLKSRMREICKSGSVRGTYVPN